MTAQNGKTGRWYKQKYTQMEAYDRLPVEVRDALKEGAQQWDSNKILLHWQKGVKRHTEALATRSAVATIRDWHHTEIQDGHPWRPRLPGQKWVDVPKSPHVQAGATMQMSGMGA